MTKERLAEIITLLSIWDPSEQPPLKRALLDLVADVELLQGAARADNERLIAAAAKAGIAFGGCDTPDDSERVVELREQLGASRKCHAVEVNFRKGAESERDTLRAENGRLRAALEAEVVCGTCEGTGRMHPDCYRCDADHREPQCEYCHGTGYGDDQCAECEGLRVFIKTQAAREALGPRS